MAASEQISKDARPAIIRAPLFRLLAINLCIGSSIAALLVSGLLWLDLGGLRHLIFADRSPGVAFGLLLFGFVVTFGSTAMGTAIMAMGEKKDDKPRGGSRLAVPALARSNRAGREK